MTPLERENAELRARLSAAEQAARAATELAARVTAERDALLAELDSIGRKLQSSVVPVERDGWCTIQFNAFLADKVTTMTMGGGNTDTVYATGDHRKEFAESLKEQHPDCVEVVWKFGRWHHQVDYSRFRNNTLKLRPGIVPTGTSYEYGMTLRKVESAA